jgi:hypothetical protein
MKMAKTRADTGRAMLARFRKRNAAPMAVPLETRRPSSRRNTALKTAAAAAAGGAGGALIGGLLVRSGVNVKTAAVGVTVAGAVGAMTLNGNAKVAAYGAAAAGAGQLALGWLADRTSKYEAAKAEAVPPPKAAPGSLPPKRQGFDDDADDLFRDAYEAEVDAYDEGT